MDRERDPQMPESECRRMLIAIAAGTAALHNGGLIHGSISPHSVFRDHEGEWRLGGQGLGLLVAAGCNPYMFPRAIPPELFPPNAQSTSMRSDVFSIAATVCCFRQGAVPRNSAPPAAVDARALFEEPRLRFALERALSSDVSLRQKTAAELLAEVTGEESPATEFDVFMCHNAADKPIIRKLAQQLKEFGLNPWLDEWQLQPGVPWQPALERQIEKIKSAAVFVGDRGLGPWQNLEQAALLRQFVARGCPVIPVLLPTAGEVPQLPLFLQGMTWVDFRQRDADPLARLVWGITGTRPSR